jgi:hypothetical protein
VYAATTPWKGRERLEIQTYSEFAMKKNEIGSTHNGIPDF